MSSKDIDLNVVPAFCEDFGLADALKELIANALDACASPLPRINVEGSTIVIEDKGPGLRRNAFIFGHTCKQNLKRFGLGLKDAIAVLVRHRASVRIESSHGTFTFVVKRSNADPEVNSIHAVIDAGTPGMTGTIVKISGVQDDAHEMVAQAKKSFLCFGDYDELHRHNEVAVLVPQKDHRNAKGVIFIDNIAIRPSTHLCFSYSFLKPKEQQRQAPDRNHTVDKDVFRSEFKGAIVDAINGLPERCFSHMPSPLRDEFKFKGVNNPLCPKHDHPASHARPSLTSRRSHSARPAQSDSATPIQTEVSQQLRNTLHRLADLPPVVPVPDVEDRQRFQATHPISSLDDLIEVSSPQYPIPDSHCNAVDKLVSFLKEERSLSVKEAYIGGSYAKGTTIGQHSDVDMVLVLNDIPTSNHARWLHYLLAHIRSIIELSFPGGCVIKHSTRFALKLRFQDVEFDILPVPAELWNMSPAERQQRFRDTRPEDRRWLSVAFTKEQVDFVKSRKETAGVAGIIRLLKHWSDNQKWGGRKYKPKNFCIELLVIKAKEDAGGTQDKVKIVDKFWELVANPENLRVTFGAEPHKSIADQRPPLVVDPANSTNNVAGEFYWSNFKAHAERFSGAGGVSAFVREMSQYVAV